MSEEKALVAVEQRTVTFYDDQIPIVLVDKAGGNQVYVPVRPICDFLGVDWSAQYRRIGRDAVLSEELIPCVVVTATQGQPDQRRELQCLPLEFINGFLFGINATRVKEEVRDRLIRYQRECYTVLSEAFQEGRLTAEPAFSDLLASDSPAVQAYKMAAAIMKMARQQILLEAKLETYGSQLDDHEQRLEEIESSLSRSDRFVTREQASRISQAVRNIGLLLTKRTGRNEYGAVYGELYRRYDISAYRELPASKYEDAIQWLNNWRQSLVDDVEF